MPSRPDHRPLPLPAGPPQMELLSDRRRSAHEILTGLDADRRLAVLHGEDQPAGRGWDADPTPLTPRRLVPPFPVDALPPWVADMVMAVAEFTQTPLDLSGCLALAALSAAAGGRAEPWRPSSRACSTRRSP